MRLINSASLIHSGVLSALVLYSNPAKPPNLLAANPPRSSNASELIYRPAREGDVMDYRPLLINGSYQIFVAVDPKVQHGMGVVGKVLWTTLSLDSVPDGVLSAMNMTEDDDATVVYIRRIEVTLAWQKKRVGSTMLTKALDNMDTTRASTFTCTLPDLDGGRKRAEQDTATPQQHVVVVVVVVGYDVV
ncbi:hypothetical protein FOZ60_011569 [Perkinsus olseni]|uniref:N-acetyltransferase domain-containing protein n=1 Tax=Perkinsus olseni TaxID=32597 RepID=A0A7J6NE53_PEROL|nr:hypothetical protein FOZ60_011569 [Perkinsus olseni]